MNSSTASLERDRALVQGMRILGEPMSVIEDFLTCLDLSDADRDELRRVARGERVGIASGDAVEMNPLTSQPQRARSRGR
jgi:hypothetical protein